MPQSLMPVARHKYWDNDNETPLAGGLLYTYAAGTSTPKATYTDSAGLVPHANPIVLDAKGEAVIYWDGAYKVDLKTAAGVQITGYPVDNYTPPTDTLRTALAAPTGSSLVVFIQSGVDAVARTVQDKLREVSVSIKDFGAVGDGVTDDYAAIIAAHDSLPSSGGVIFAPRGTYLHNTKLTFTKRIRLIGEGTHSVNGVSNTEFLKGAGIADNGVEITAVGGTVEAVAFRGESGNTGDGVLIKAARVALRDVAVFDMGQDGIRIGTDSGGENCNLWLLDNVKAKNNGRDGVRISEGAGPLADANAGTCLHLDAQFNGAAGVHLVGAQLNTFVGGAYQNNGSYGIHIGPDAEYNAFFGGDPEANTVSQVRIESGAEHNFFYMPTMLLSLFSIAATTENNRIECIDHNRLVCGLKFPPTQVASSDANTLDDYEEGTFTPAISGATSAGTGTYTSRVGRYTKVGRKVNFTINITWTAHTGTGNTEITGLPFTSANTADTFDPVSILQSGGPAPGAGLARVAFIQPNTTKIQLREFNPGTAALTNSNAITASGTFYISGTFTV